MWSFRRKYHYWLIAFVTPTGGIRHVITRYRNKRLTLARILQAAIGEGLDTNCVVLPPSYLGKMTEAQANRGQFGYRKLLYVKLIFYHFWFFWKRNILDVKTVMRGH